MYAHRTGQRGELGHGGVLPDDDLVLAVAVRGDDLVHVLGPRYVAHLGEGKARQRFSMQGSRCSGRRGRPNTHTALHKVAGIRGQE